MALKLYMTGNTITGFSSAVNQGAWDLTTSSLGTRRMHSTLASVGTNSVKTIAVGSVAAAYDVLSTKFQSDALASGGSITGNVQWILGCRETNAALNGYTHMHIWVTQGDTDTVRGTLLTDDVGATEWTTASPGTGLASGQIAVSSVTAVTGDRIIAEVGYRAATSGATTYSGTTYRGGASAELASGGDASLACGWFEFSGINADYTIPVSAAARTSDFMSFF